MAPAPQRRWLATLQARVTWAVMGAFVLVAVVLLAHDYVQFWRDWRARPGLVPVGTLLWDDANRHADARDARLTLAAAERLINHSRSETTTHAGEVLGPVLVALAPVATGLAEPVAGAWPAPVPVVLPDVVTTLDLGGQPHWVWRSIAGAHWSVVMAEPVVADATVLSWLVSALAPSLLLALPLVWLPVWWAVRVGLRPLTVFSSQLRLRQPGNLAALPPVGGELAQVAQAFNGLLARLRAHVQREQAFVQDAAHELRTPLAAIVAQAHLLAQATSPAERHEALADLQRTAQRAAHLSQQLLTLAQAGGLQDSAPPVLDLAELLRDTVAQLLSAHADKAAFELQAPDHLHASVPAAAFNAVVRNLVENALRHTPDTAQVQVCLAALGDGGSAGWQLAVADDGPGLPPTLADRAFDRFVRGAGASVPGTGLGLAIVKEAVAALGGEVSLHPGLNGVGLSVVVAVRGAGDVRT